MATQKRPKDEAPASSPASDDIVLIDGATNGVRALGASYFTNNFAPIPDLDREIRADEPIAYWPMTEASGGFSDAIYGDRTLVPSGTVDFQYDILGSGVMASARIGTVGAATLAANPVGLTVLQSGVWSFETVVRFRDDPISAPKTRLFFVGVSGAGTASEDDNSQFDLYADGDGLIYLDNESGTRVAANVFTSLTPVLSGDAHHIAVTADGFSARLYVDGALKIVQPLSLPTGGANAITRIGYQGVDINRDTAQGYVAFYDYTLTPARVMAHAVNLARA